MNPFTCIRGFIIISLYIHTYFKFIFILDICPCFNRLFSTWEMWLGWRQDDTTPLAFKEVSKWGQPTDNPNKGVHEFIGDTPGKRQNVAPHINKDSTLYSIFMYSCTFQTVTVLLTQRSKLWQTIETEKCFLLLEQHVLKILRSFWTSGCKQSSVLHKGRVNFRHNTNILESKFTICVTRLVTHMAWNSI
jgi:hypothetical protein